MTTVFKKLTLAIALTATALGVAAPAEAQRYGGYRGRDNGSTAILAGVAGLAIGAAIASSANRRDGAYYDDGYDGRANYRQGYDVYYQQDGRRGYNGYDGYNGYRDDRNGYRDDRRGGYDHRGYGDQRNHRGFDDQRDHRGFDGRGNGYRR